ncbi:MAG: DUF4838 domain-containing protein [Gemmataceae bacterium]
MKHMIILLGCVLGLSVAQATAAERFLVQDGKGRAEIVIAEKPPRTVRLAAHELRTYVEKMSGARLPIVTQPSCDMPVQVYVGRSPHTDRLGITPEGLKYGAYRIVSGDNWLVLIGDDTDFTPIEPWARNNGDIASGKLQREWNRITDAQWGVPNGGMYKHRIRLPGDIGKPEGATTAKNEYLELWGFDERGSFNAVCGFLRGLGVRWYQPGELGEVVPEHKTIPLPKLDETVHPDFPLRRFNIRFSVVGRDTAMWAMRLGVRDPYGVQVAHGLATMTQPVEIFNAHPDWFALYGGKRHYQPGSSKNQLCYSNEELFQQTVRYARAQLDQYKLDTVSIMPPDGYTAICQCPLCEGKDTPERGSRGALSDYVWDFVNRVAKEVGKTHPDKKILNCAYGIYTLPPEKLDKLEPNVVVCIVGGRRPSSNRPEERETIRKLREAWAAKTANPIMIFENYPFTDRGWYLPAYFITVLAESINATKGMSQGEDIWLSVGQNFDKTAIGFNHFLVYFTARMYWGGKDADIKALFDEYCRLFYGPAAPEIKVFFEYCEANWRDMEKDKAKADTALAHFAAAQAKADPASVYGQRIALIDDYLKGLRNKSTQLGQKRGPVPKLRLVGEAPGKIVIDGKLDDDAWMNCPTAATGRLRELQTGRTPTYGTTVKAAWIGNNVYFAIRCEERPGEKLNITATKKGDAALWYGDAVEVLLETESRSYYQIAVNPAGAVVDLDRSAPKSSWFNWDAQAEVATHVADDHWTVEIRIPVTQDENDPLHQVIGRKPTQSLPWHINICRQRIRENGSEYSALSPTGSANFHHVMKFAHFYDGRSHQFEAAELDNDFLTTFQVAMNQARQGQHADALAALTKLADGKITDFQKSAVLEQAAASARTLKNHDLAVELISRIPIVAVKKTARMHDLLARQKAPEVVAEFGDEDISAWPFWQQGDGYFARGRAYAITKAGKEADADLTRALAFTNDFRTRQRIWLALGNNREQTLKDDAAALAAYGEVIKSVAPIGGADEFHAVQSIARIHTRLRQYDEALATLRKVEIAKLNGFWRGSMQLAIGDTLQAAGRKGEALTVYRAASADELIEPRQRKAAAEKIKTLEEK